MINSRWLLPLLVTIAAGCAHAATERIHYADFAGEPVSGFQYTNLYNWQRVGDHDIAVWTKPSQAYLVDLVDHCQPVESRYSLQFGGVASISGRVRTGDDVDFGQLHCRILAIRPLDLERMKRK